MDDIGCVDPSLLIPPSPPPAPRTTGTGITLFEPGVDGISEGESAMEVNAYHSLPEDNGKQSQDYTPFDCGIDDAPSYVGSPPVARSTAHWVNQNVPLLREYAMRQVNPPLTNRINVKLNHPSQFVTGVMQMLANRDKGGGEDPEPTRQMSPQLLEGYVDLDRWAKEYLRTQFGFEYLGEGVPNLLIIIANNFYEAHMYLMDAIMGKAISNMETRRGPFLEAGDFNFGFDLRMAQEMPFLVSSEHRVRETRHDLHSSSKPSTALTEEGVSSRYGRRLKPTAGALQAREEPPRVQPKQIMPKVPRKVKKVIAAVSPPGTDGAGVPVADVSPPKKDRTRKQKPEVKTPVISDGPSEAVSKARQPLSETSLANADPPERAGGGKTLAHLSVIQRHASVPVTTSRQAALSFDQRPLKIAIKPLTQFTSKVLTPKDSVPGNTLTLNETASKGTTDATDLPCNTADDLAGSNTATAQGPSAANSVTHSNSHPLPEVPSLEISQRTNATNLKRKRKNSVESG